MSASTKRRRAGNTAANGEGEEEEELVASLFGGKRSRRMEETEVGEDSDEEEKAGPSSERQNAEQYLDDDDLFILDADRDEEEDGSDGDEEENEDEDGDGDGDGEEESEADGGFDIAPTASKKVDDAVPASKSQRRRPVWTDAGSSNLQISLAGANTRGSDGSRKGTEKLRKLREEEGETEITGAEYEVRLRRIFEKIHPRPSWASLSLRKAANASSSGENGRETLSDLLSRDAGLVSRLTSKRGKQSRARLAEGRFDVERLRNANEAQGRSTLSSIETLSFHPTTRAHLMMTTTKDRRLRLFQVDGNTNPLLETLHIADLPLQSALFHPSGSSILLSGKRPFFYSHDLESGKTIKSTPWRGFGSSAQGAEEKDLSNVCFQNATGQGDRSLLAIGGRRGAIHLLEWGSVGGSGGGSLVGSLFMNAPLAGLSWNPSQSNSLVSLSKLGTIHAWDVRNLKCEVQKSDAGLFSPTGIKGSPGGDWWAVGSENGIVNMYGSEAVDGGKGALQSQKAIKNITMPTSTLQYNHSGEILAIASDKKKDALKFAHLPSLTVFENWPTSGTPLGRVTSLDFSNGSEYVAIGNSRGKVLLYSLHHYI